LTKKNIFHHFLPAYMKICTKNSKFNFEATRRALHQPQPVPGDPSLPARATRLFQLPAAALLELRLPDGRHEPAGRVERVIGAKKIIFIIPQNIYLTKIEINFLPSFLTFFLLK
jgi:hypothetical protein